MKTLKGMTSGEIGRQCKTIKYQIKLLNPQQQKFIFLGIGPTKPLHA